MKVADIKTQLTPGKNFTFTLPGQVTQLVVDTNDGTTLTGKIVGGPSDVQKTITWSLIGLDEVHGVDPA